MIETPEIYKSLMNEPVRNQTFVKGILYLTDPTLYDKISYSYENAEYYSTGILQRPVESYITLEKNWFKADGSQSVLGVDPELNGLVGKLNESVTVIVSISESVDIKGLSFNFAGNVPQRMIVNEMEVVPDNNFYVYEAELTNVSEIQITLYPQQDTRVRLSSLELGKGLLIDSHKVISTRHDISCDPLALELYHEEIRLNLYDLEHVLDPEKEDSIWHEIKTYNKLELYYGIDNVEFLRSTLFIDSKPTFHDNNAFITACDRFAFLNNIYKKGTYQPSLVYNICRDMLQNWELGDFLTWDNPISLQQIYNSLPEVPVSQCLQLIANAFCCYLWVSTEGTVVFTNEEYQRLYFTNDVITKDKMFSQPELNMNGVVRNVIVKVHTPTPSDDVDSTLYSQSNITVSGELVIQMDYEAAKDITFILSTPTGSDVDVSTMQAYSKHATFTLTGEGSNVTLTVLGTKMTEYVSDVVVTVTDEGEDLIIDNPLITSTEQAQRVGEWIKSHYMNREHYEFNTRQDYSYTVGGPGSFYNKYDKQINGIVTKLQFNTPGQTGAIKVWKQGG